MNGCLGKEGGTAAKKESTRKQDKALRARATETAMSPLEEMERWFERLGRQNWMRHGLRKWPPYLDSVAAFRGGAPKIDVVDRESELVVRAELPGAAKEDLDVTVTDDSVTLKAHTSHEEKEERGEYYRRETSCGEYRRTVHLPHTINGEKAKATFKDGMLELTLPKEGKTSRKKVKVE